MRMTRRINRPINFNPRTREGCDLFTIYLAHYYIRFQSTHPRGVRRDPLSFNTCCFVISIHAPARGATVSKFIQTALFIISIHAPARGATEPFYKIYNNPNISIHAPARGATLIDQIFNLVVEISIHAPARGATANTANRLPVFTPLLQHILQDFTSIRHIQNAETAKKSKNQVRNSWQFHVRSRFAPVLK